MQGPEHSLRPESPTRPLFVVLGVTVVFAMVELVGGLVSGSLALVSDSGHMFTDVLALGLSLWAGYMVMKAAGERQTFGFLRVEILVALINGVILVVLSLLIIYEAIQRLQSPPEVQSGLMLIVALMGLGANLFGVYMLRNGAKENLNVKGALLHIIGDLLSSIGVIISALLIYIFGFREADPIMSFVIAAIIIYGSYQIISQSTKVLLEFTPSHIDIHEVEEELKKVPGVEDVHDIHAWTLGSGVYAMSGHVKVAEQPISACSCIVSDCEQVLAEKFKISHSTLQLEYKGCEGVCYFQRKNESELAPKHEHGKQD
ncbi:MAG: cation diffusion facilitator family transporter [Methanomassiliicoccales archaeon]|nr:cation diffusion facilitator family transporter [Methanomassiliicoccales archaeon]